MCSPRALLLRGKANSIINVPLFGLESRQTNFNVPSETCRHDDLSVLSADAQSIRL